MTASDESKRERELMRAYVAGEDGAFEELYRLHSERVYSYLFAHVQKNRSLADDLHQAVFLKFHRSRDRYDSKYSVLQWLYVISRSVLIDELRRSRRQVPVEEGADPEAFAAPVSQNTPASSLDLVTAGLTAEQAKVLELRIESDLPYDEIARRLGKSQAGVRKTLSRAVAKLRALNPGLKKRSEE